MFTKSNLIKIFINTGLGVGLIFIWLRLINLDKVLEEVSKINFVYLIPAVLFMALANLLRALRLKLLLRKFDVSFKNLAFLCYLSQFLSFTIPIRAGEIARGVYLSTHLKDKKTGEYISFPKSLVWILVDRFIDFWLILVLAGILLFLIPTNISPSAIKIVLLLILAISFGFMAVLFQDKVIIKLASLVKNIFIIETLKIKFTRIVQFLVDCSTLLKVGVGNTLLILFITLLALICDSIPWIIIFGQLSKDSIDPWKLILGQQLTALTFLIPAAPGYIGSQEASGFAVFNLILGLGKDLSSAATLVIHSAIIIYVLVFGLLSLYLLKFNLKLVLNKFKKK